MQLMFCFFGIPTLAAQQIQGTHAIGHDKSESEIAFFFTFFLDGELTTLTMVGLLQVFSHETTINHWCFGPNWNMAVMTSPIVGMMIQSDELIFFRGVGIPWYTTN